MFKVWPGNGIEILSLQVVLQYNGVLTFGYLAFLVIYAFFPVKSGIKHFP